VTDRESTVAMKLRIARHTDQLDAVVAFYRDRIGFPELGRFEGHDWYDGVFLEIPGTGAHLEFTTGGHPAPEPHPESLPVLYLDSPDELDAIIERLVQAPVSPANPYWQRNARYYTDPDGFQILLTVSG
jgi:catechol 2,3-dioxygenase-like lactoylglutathione lyase family enzyme